MKKLLFMLCACIVLAIPCFADNEVYFTDNLTSTGITGSITTYNFSDGSSGYFYRVSLNENNTQFKICAISTVADSSVVVDAHGTTTTHYTDVPIGSYFYKNISNYYTNTGVTISPDIAYFPYGTTDSDIISSFAGFVENLPVEPNEVTFNLPCGNALYFKVGSNQTIKFTSHFSRYNTFLNSSGDPWGDTGQRFGTASSLPNSNTTFPLSGQSLPRYFIDASSKNILGQSKNGITHFDCVPNTWYCFYNPAFDSQNTDISVMDITGPSVTVNGAFSEIKIFPLEQLVDFQNGSFVTTSNDNFDSFFDGTNNDNGTVTFTNQDGNVSMPSAGGQNFLEPSANTQSLVQRIEVILNSLIESIKTLFSFGYEAINSLTGLMSDFVSVFSQLYTWLPSPIYQALIAAVTIAITIGVFKVFL